MKEINLDYNQYGDAGKIIELQSAYELKTNYINLETELQSLYSKLNKYYVSTPYYKISSGDSIETISKNFNISQNDLLKLNPGINKNTILKLGQKINIPKNVINKKTLSDKDKKFIEKCFSEIKTIQSKLEVIKKEYLKKTKVDLKELAISIKKSNNTTQNTDLMEKSNKANETIRQIQYNKEVENILKDPRGKPFVQYLGIINNYRTNTSIFREEIPLKTILLLLVKEGSWGKLEKKAPHPHTAVGLGQINDKTWKELCNNTINNPEYNGKISLNINKRYDKDEQIKAMLLLLDQCARKHNCTYQEAVVYYHMGLNGDKISDAKAAKDAKENLPIQNLAKIDGVKITTAEQYRKYAFIYYSTLNT